MKRRWSKVLGVVHIELSYDEDGNLIALDSEKNLNFLKPFTGEELSIYFHSSGYYDPGSMYGGPDRLGWPPEGDDERVLFYATIDNNPIPANLAQQVFDLFEAEVMAAEISTDE